jgi:plasmid maintenance system killer protein
MNLKFREKLLVNLFLTGCERNIPMQYKSKLLKLLKFLKSIFKSNILINIYFFGLYLNQE